VRGVSLGDLAELFAEQYPTVNRIVVMGGEPLESEFSVLTILQVFQKWKWVEVEITGYIKPTRISEVHYWNVSPKLSTSGIPYDSRINLTALQWFVDHTNHSLKFCVGNKEDVEEVRELVSKLTGKPHVYVMPSGDTLEEYEATFDFAVEVSLKRGWRFSPRLQMQFGRRK
jgi:7-carboxy-7-deazaguanine synthase